MSDPYIIYGVEMSPYSVKVRSYFRYKNIPHRWIVRNMSNMDEYKQVAKIPIVPAVRTPDGGAMQDSTPIMDNIDAAYPDPSTHPDDPALAYLSVLIEEFGDEWGNKIMFHHRWWDPLDQQVTARTLARGNMPEASSEELDGITKMVLDRMTGRGHFVGSSAETAPLIEVYMYDLLDVLEAHLETRPYLFGSRPAFGDFGLSAQLYELSIDPTGSSIMRAKYPNTLSWCHRMLDPTARGEFENWADLKTTLLPLIQIIGKFFLPWSVANAKALEAGNEQFEVDLDGEMYRQPPQKYHAKSLKVLRDKYIAVSDKTALDPVLEETGCLQYLKA